MCRAFSGVFAVQPYLFYTRQLGIYDSNSHLVKDRNDHLAHLLLSLETGITKKIDISIYLNASYSSADDEKSFDFGDTAFFLGFQIAKSKKNCWVPDVRLMIGESIPTGRFDKLGQRSRGVNSTGTGSFETFVIFIVRKIFYTWPKHPYNWNLNLYYISFTEVNVDGVSVYGGGPGTRGRVRPGEQFIGNLAFEYKFNHNWGTGIDIHYQHWNQSTFHTKEANTTPAGLPSSESFSLAPDIEYCFNENLSFNIGCWFSVTGRNSLAFQSAVATVYYAF